MEISCPIKPTEIVETCCVYNQRFSFPPAIGPTHPTVGRSFGLIGHIDCAKGACKLEEHRDLLRTLDDLERVWHVHGARNARQIALRFRIQTHPVSKVLLPLLQSFRFVGNLTAFNNADARCHGVSRSELPERTWSRGVSFNVPVGLVHALPHAAEIGFAVLRPGRAIRRRLSRCLSRSASSLTENCDDS